MSKRKNKYPILMHNVESEKISIVIFLQKQKNRHRYREQMYTKGWGGGVA